MFYWKDLTSHQKICFIEIPSEEKLTAISNIVNQAKSPFKDAEATFSWILEQKNNNFVLKIWAMKLTTKR